MLKNITLGQYFPGDSLVHSLDPRMKIVLTLALIIVVFLVESIFGFIVLAAFIALVTILARVGAASVLRSIRPLLFIIIFTFILNMFFYNGQTVLWQWGAVRLTEEGIYKAVLIVLRLTFLIFSTSLLTLTTSPMQLTDGMESLMKPLSKIKFPVHEMAMMMSIALRFIPTLAEETDRIMKAQMARGAEFDSGNLIKKSQKHGSAAGAAFYIGVQAGGRACAGHGVPLLQGRGRPHKNEDPALCPARFRGACPHRRGGGCIGGGFLMRIKLTIEYDGTGYCGWQRQKNAVKACSRRWRKHCKRSPGKKNRSAFGRADRTRVCTRSGRPRILIPGRTSRRINFPLL